MREHAKRWLEFSEDDLEVAVEAARIGKYGIAAYHCQQAVEKSIKAILILISDGPTTFKTHDIEKLLKGLLRLGVDPPPFVWEATKLTDYAFSTRYPDDYVPVSKEEYEEAYEIAKKVLEWAKEIVRP